MKHSKPMILLLTVLLTAIAVVFGRNEIGMRNFPFSVMVTSDGGQQELSCMKLGGEFYVFLPWFSGGFAFISDLFDYDVCHDGVVVGGINALNGVSDNLVVFNLKGFISEDEVDSTGTAVIIICFLTVLCKCAAFVACLRNLFGVIKAFAGNSINQTVLISVEVTC